MLATDTLVTKIMLGVFGNVPAFDGNFKEGLRQEGLTRSDFDGQALKNIAKFYSRYKTYIDDFRPILTLDLQTGKDSTVCYTKAKLVDMAVWIEGEAALKLKREKSKNEKQNQ